MKFSDKAKTLFENSAYFLEGNIQRFSVINKYNHGLILFLSAIVGVILIRIGMFGKIGLILLGLMVTFGPWVFLNWRFPKEVLFDKSRKKLTNYNGLSGTKSYTFRKVNDFFVESYRRHAFVSAFEEGNKEYIYEFHVRLKTLETKRMFRIISRKRIDSPMKELVKFLDDLLLNESQSTE